MQHKNIVLDFYYQHRGLYSNFQTSPDNKDISNFYNDQGQNYFNAKDFASAQHCFAFSFSFNIYNSEACVNFAYAQWACGNGHSAIAAFSTAFATSPIGYDPYHTVIYHNRGLLFYLKKNYAAAIEDLNKSIDLEPANPTSYYTRACSYYHLDEYNKAYSDFLTVRKLCLLDLHDRNKKMMLSDSSRVLFMLIQSGAVNAEGISANASSFFNSRQKNGGDQYSMQSLRKGSVEMDKPEKRKHRDSSTVFSYYSTISDGELISVLNETLKCRLD